jgi:hypothetical protein
MYTLETRYRPIPPKVLPQPTKSKVNYLESPKLEENSVPNPVKMQEGRSFFLLISIEMICFVNIRTRGNTTCRTRNTKKYRTRTSTNSFSRTENYFTTYPL